MILCSTNQRCRGRRLNAIAKARQVDKKHQADWGRSLFPNKSGHGTGLTCSQVVTHITWSIWKARTLLWTGVFEEHRPVLAIQSLGCAGAGVSTWDGSQWFSKPIERGGRDPVPVYLSAHINTHRIGWTKGLISCLRSVATTHHTGHNGTTSGTSRDCSIVICVVISR